MITKRQVMAKLRDGRLRPGKSYEDKTIAEIAAEYLKRCKERNICAECYNDLTDGDRRFGGEDTNECISCACC